MRLIFIINVFNEADHIGKAISSIHDVADEVWVFDGAYKNYPHEKPYSTDGTLEIAKKFPKVKIFDNNKEAWESQIAKRSEMFKNGKEGDYFFKLDGDEYVTNPEIIREYLNCDVGWAWTLSNIYDTPVMITRLFKFHKGMHYAGRHHWLFDGNNNFIVSDQRMNLRFKHQDTPIRVFNFRDSSTVKRIEEKKTFLANRNPEEQSYAREDMVYDKPCGRLMEHPNRAGKPSRRTVILREVDNPKYTFTSMISRGWALTRYFDNLDLVSIPKNTEAVILVDSTILGIRRRVLEYFERDKRFIGVKIIYTDNPRLPETSQVSLRRQRIINNWHLILTETRGEIILGSEDDSLQEPEAYTKLLATMDIYKADFVQGNIIGRWGTKICPAWKVIEKDGEPIALYNKKEKQEGVSEVEGVGWYCFVSPADVVRKYAMQVDPLLPLGPDVRFGYQLSRNGFKLLHQWDVKVKHFGEDFLLIPGMTETEQRIWFKRKNGEWGTKEFDETTQKLIEGEFNLELE